MPKPRLVAATLLALAVAVPTAAGYAAPTVPVSNTYRSTTLKDALDDVEKLYPAKPVDDPSIDIYKLVGYRYAENFVVTVTFKHLTAAAYTHRFVGFGDASTAGDTDRNTLVDLAVGARGAPPSASVFVLKTDDEGEETSSYEFSCPGAKASPDYRTGKVTYTLPVDCLRNYDQQEAYLYGFAARWTQRQWRTSPLGPEAPTDIDTTDADDLWVWDRDASPRAGVTPRHHLGS